MSPLQIPAGTPPRNTKPHVSGHLPSPNPLQPAKLRTEAANNLIKRVKRAAFGFTNFDNYRIRALLYAGKPNWALLETVLRLTSRDGIPVLSDCI